MQKSLDPRVARLPHQGVDQEGIPKKPLDQFGTFEVFVQPKEGKVFQHEGIVHSPNLEMAYVLAKETFTRRFTCTSLYVTETKNIFSTPTSEGDQNVYDLISDVYESSPDKKNYEIYHLLKRGKQHVHAGSVAAANPQEAFALAKAKLKGDKTVYNVWAIRTDDIRFTSPEENDLWITLPEKKFRDAGDYKGGDKLKEFLERNKN